jgi:ankyrin repeat protein
MLLAAHNGYTAIAQLLPKIRVNNRKDPKIISTVMVRAASEGWEAIVQPMLENGNAKNWQGLAALLLAIKKEAATVVQLLLEKGANVEVKDTKENTTLVYAAQLRNGAIVRLLFEKGADVEVEDQYENVALFWATKLGRKAVTQLLLREDIPTAEGKDASRMVSS